VKISNRLNKNHLAAPIHKILTSVIGASVDDAGEVSDMLLVLTHHLAGLIAFTQKESDFHECRRQIDDLLSVKLSTASANKTKGLPYCRPELMCLSIKVLRTNDNFQMNVERVGDESETTVGREQPLSPDLERASEIATKEIMARFQSGA